MLEPDQRRLLIDALTPPPDMTLDYAVGTTFSLDLEALLIAPVAFALFDARVGEHGAVTASDPLSLLEAVRRHADRMDIFCQAGQIAVPRKYQPILVLLEDSIHPAAASNKYRIFHAKTWVLRFVGEGTTSYRMLCLSRNLTFDKSWDVLLRLDGAPGTTTNELGNRNQPLVDFVAALPDLSIVRLTDRAARVRELAEELRSVEFEIPAEFSGIAFHPSGIPGYPVLSPPDGSRRLVISPFLARKAIEQLALEDSVLVSRPESLDRLPQETLYGYEAVKHLSDGTTDIEATDDGGPSTDEALAERVTASLSGLHAKVIVTDQGWDASVMVGSANVTEAGLGGNVELMVELKGRRAKCGVDAILGSEKSDVGLLTFLSDYHRPEAEPAEMSDAEKVAYRLDEYGRELARVAFTAAVEEDGDGFQLRITGDRPLPRGDVALRVWPITLSADTASAGAEPGEPLSASFAGLSLTAITSFFAIELSADSDTGPVMLRLVVNARLVGAPADRHQRILTAQLSSRADVLRYLLLLLAAIGDDSAQSMAEVLLHGASSEGDGHAFHVPLFESMVRALARSPEALDHVARLIDDLSSTEEGRDLLPEGIEEVWGPIWETRQELRT